MTAPAQRANDFLAELPGPASRLLLASRELSFARDVATIAEITRVAARELTGADGVTFVVRDGTDCYYLDEAAIAPLWKGRRFPLESCVSGWVMTHGTAVALEDVFADPRVPADAYRSTFVKSLAMVPVGTPDAIAAVGAYWADTHAATKAELGVMQVLADTVALALENVRLYDGIYDAARRENQARLAAESANRDRDEFVAQIAHELRQPLQASLSALRVMSLSTDAPLLERARAIVDRQLSQMHRLVEDLVDAARIVRGHVDLAIVDADIAAVLRAVVDAVEPVMQDRQLRFTATLTALPMPARVDAFRLHQVLMNLLSNSAKYTEPGGAVELAADVKGDTIVIVVRDTGRGISADLLPRVFEMFTRGDRDDRGFGVGLTVARRLVELHAGTLAAFSAGPGQGSEFVVTLPLAR